MSTRVFHADAIFPGDSSVIRDGAVVVSDVGEVMDVGPADEILPRHAGANVTRVRGVVMPGLVNAHLHIELSALRGRVPGGRGFVPWVDALIATRTEVQEDETEAAISRAIDDLESFGTVVVGEVTNSLAAVRLLAARGFTGCVFHEVFGTDPERVLARVAGLREEATRIVGDWPRALAYAPAPHTLYTTHPDAVRAIVELTSHSASQRSARTSIHLAEHPQERAAIETGGGAVPPWLANRLKIAANALTWPNMPLFDFAESLGVLSPRTLLVHLADARPPELDRVARANAPVVLCPRSNLYIEMRLPPLLAMREAGIAPALGTDSLASNASLDVLAEARALYDRFPHVPAEELLRMATWNGARALGVEGCGRIARGARPGLFAIAGDLRDASREDAARFVLKNVSAPRTTMVKRSPS